ncbi:DUF6193 family natural product biosynthesis protein [Kineosporia babensis]|uniref:DUF6193 family natural product biosynthesis protein n=1 Tax=Kineosporia babensis TaxID=499548 RepID=A0A9X1NB58_9ACTN|nr:DUF6193 family natural product biosynthesis protein [Kineosporia babensis]MCD5310485.1 DUF6193 family natural product biosynthesis protein [Kineosporia babensis]
MTDSRPELDSSESLRAALLGAAVQQDLDLGEVVLEPDVQVPYAGVTSLLAEREPFWVALLWPEQGLFSYEGWGQGIELLTDDTDDLAEVARIAAGWRRGLPLREIQQTAPSLQISELAEAHERGPAHVVDLRWRNLLTGLQKDTVSADPGIRARGQDALPLAEAAAAEPQLRQLSPYLSHYTLHFSRCTGQPPTADVPFVVPLGEDYEVRGNWTIDRFQTLGRATTAQQAVALVLNHLPPRCGPAVSGTSETFAG